MHVYCSYCGRRGADPCASCVAAGVPESGALKQGQYDPYAGAVAPTSPVEDALRSQIVALEARLAATERRSAKTKKRGK